MAIDNPTAPYTLEVHGAAYHTDINRELFIPAFWAKITGCIQSNKGEFPCIRFTDGQDQQFLTIMKVPDDFVSFVSLKAIWLSDVAAGNMYWQTHAGYATHGESYATHSDTPAYGVTATSGNNFFNIQEPTNPLTLASLAIGDIVNFRFQRDGGHINDTLNSWVWVFGLLFTYEANQ